MNFWEAQRRARRQTTIYLCLFVIMTVVTAVLAELTMRLIADESYNPPYPILGGGFLIATFLVAGFNYLRFRSGGGSYVAESLGGYPLDPSNPREQQLYNIVQELAVATSLPMPKIYILPAQEINAFAAGLNSKEAAIAITEGALKKLNRDEIQGVIAHEFGHIYNSDMVISLRLAAMVLGFFFVLYIGLRILQGAGFRRRDDSGGKGNPILLAAILLIAAGALAWFMGSILKATVSRQREYLADASAVQFTRNPYGIANALRKIENDQNHDMPSNGSAYSHMYLEDHTSIFATHPPIQKRIAAILGADQKSDKGALPP
ncbi:MAG: M48 family metallopeptidase [Parachlamydiaceae bacterium]|nr:M48 family metallopeptidase [Parachlamydiaceae bacterium]